MSRFFDKVDDFVENTGYPLGSMPSAPISMGAWMKPTDAGEAGLGVVIRRVGTSEFIMISFANSTNRLKFTVDRSTNTDRMTNDFPFGAWRHVFATWDGTDSYTGMHVYNCGVEVTYTSEIAGTGTHDSSDGTPIMGNITNRATTFAGHLAHGMIFDRVLSAGEIRQICYYPGSIRNGLRLWWPLWGGTPEGDYSGNNAPGTVGGATVSTDNPPINGIFYPERPNLYYSSFSTAVAPPGDAVIMKMALMGMG